MAKEAVAESSSKKEEAKPDDSAKQENTSTDKSSKDSSKDASKKEPAKEELKTGDRIFATPIAKKIALEKGIPLAQVKGTGPEGRITREDVEKFKGASGAAGAGLAPPTPAPASADEYTDTPISSMRRVIGQRLTESKQERPHYYVTVDVDMSKVNKLREVFNASLAGKEGASKISVNDFVMKAVSLALAEVPEANSAWLGDVIRQYVRLFLVRTITYQHMQV
jgi:pyruvate dehydrogenase E2 component (dihydrolipoamide acetyltransferase)